MAAPASSSLFMSLGNAWRLLSLRSDVDDIILELLGHFSLEKIYAESNKETYQHLVTTLLAQLNAVYHIQRLTLPNENLQAGSLGWYLGFLASWEVTLRSVEFVLQVVEEGREILWEAQSLRDKYLPEFLLSALRFLSLHPKAPANQRAKDRRERFARIHRSLERIYDRYPGSKSFLLLVCREVTASLRTEPNNALALPKRLRYELPNLASELYPLPECLSSPYISTIVPKSGFPGDWLSQFLALRDVSHFVIGASIQYSVNGETRDVRLQSSSARTRNAVLHVLENLNMPEPFSQVDLVAMFSEAFRIILPHTPSFVPQGSSDSEHDETEMDAIDALCHRLSNRLLIHRLSDREMMSRIAELNRNVALLDDPSAQFRTSRPRLYAMNCSKSHLGGDTQLRMTENLEFATDPAEGSEIKLPPNSKCCYCGETITMMREVSLARHTWDLIRPLEPNADTLHVERHLPTQFQLSPPRAEIGIFNPSYGNSLSGGEKSPGSDLYSSFKSPSTLSSSLSKDRSRSAPQALMFSQSPNFRQHFDTPRTETFLSDSHTLGSSDEATYFSTQIGPESQSIASSSMAETKFSPELVVAPLSINRPIQAEIVPPASNISVEPAPVVRSQTVPLFAPPEKSKSGWRSKLTKSKKEIAVTSGDSSSISSTTLESQRLEEISLKSLTIDKSSKSSSKSKNSKNFRDFNVSLSQNSSSALFWSHSSIHILDVGKSPPTIIHSTSTDSTCIMAAVTKLYLAYIIKSQDQKLTLRIVNLVQAETRVLEYRMPQSPYCSSICICPRENYVVVGFEKPIVRFFKTSQWEQPREDRLHSRYHDECKGKDCPPVGMLSFSNDGLVLLATTRSLKNGTISFYSWKYPFISFQEESKCRYHVPLHESEDNGVSSAMFRSGSGAEPDLICVTTWTLSGGPVLIQTQDGQKTDIKTEKGGHQGQLGCRIQCAAFSPSGKELAMVNAKGHLYQILNLNSSPLDVRRIATSLELTKREDFFAMSYMTLLDEEAIVLAWVDSSKALGYVKKIPIRSQNEMSSATTPATIHATLHHDPTTITHHELHGESITSKEMTLREEAIPLTVGQGKRKDNSKP